MSSFVRSIHLFQSGQLSQDELLEEINRHLAIERASPTALLEILASQQLIQPLHSDVHKSILNCLRNWPQDPTVITRSNEVQGGHRRPAVGVGEVLQGRFDLVELLGEGGMSRVFKAVDLRRVEAKAEEPWVAVKVLTEPFSEYFGSITAMQREAHKLQSLSHRNIVRVFDFDRDGQTVFMTMEYLAGESLQKKLHAGDATSFARSAAESVISAIMDALEYAHANDIVHGDLKPGNVIMTTQGDVKVIDFGMARFVAGGTQVAPDVRADETPKAVTPRYASPQLLAGQDPKATDDVYALACIAYECLSGNVPFEHPGNLKGIDSSLRPRPPEIPTHQYLALMKALAPDPKDRTTTVRQFRAEFMAMRDKRGNRWAWIGVAAAVVALFALFALYQLHLPHQASSPLSVGTPIRAPGSVIRDCPTCPLMIVLPVGQFTQGADSGDPDVLPSEQPPHAVVIGYPLAMSKNEITVGEFRDFAEATQREMSGCNTYDGEWGYRAAANWQAPGFSQGAEHPVACTSWNDAVAYAKWLSQKSGHSYRLPSASEWEYAARAGSDSAPPWAPNPSDACADANVADQTAAQRFPGWETFPCSDGYVSTAPVGSFKANAFGLNDLLGNVFEWVGDCWHPDYRGAPTDGRARLDGDCKEHELRGGSWFSSPRVVNAAYRNRFGADYRSSTVGFRLVREVSP